MTSPRMPPPPIQMTSNTPKKSMGMTLAYWISRSSSRRAKLVGTTLYQAKLAGTELSGADLSDANLAEVQAERCGLGRRLRAQRVDQRRLFLLLCAGLAQCCRQCANAVLQIGTAIPFKPKRARQRRNLGPKRVKLGGLPADLFTQNELHHHTDGQHEHQDQQKPGHCVDKSRPDRALKPCSGAP